jgi:hypothetical protein
LKKRPLKIAITGTHSTGKSTFLDKVESDLKDKGLVVERFQSIAVEARNLGFPILSGHTVDSTLWIMAECIQREAIASITADVILVDRPVSDALGYLEAALEVSGRSANLSRMDVVRGMARAYMSEYDFIIETVLDRSVPLGPGRDPDDALRVAAAYHIAIFAREYGARRLTLTSINQTELLEEVLGRVAA